MNSISLLELQKIVKQNIDSLPQAYWITAEIAQISVSSAGHCFLELAQYSNNTNNVGIAYHEQTMIAKASATIWANVYHALAAFFAETTDMMLCEGMKIMVRVNVQYHVIYGLKLNIIDIDPAYTVGEAEVRRNKIIARLRSENVINQNKELAMPLLPQRIAVISSEHAAGYRDFMEHLHKNPEGYFFITELFAASVQGNTAEQSIIDAINAIFERSDEFDVVTILRGGGSASDLACFDSYNIAYLVTQFPIPVITGIGHDKDISVVDHTAHTMLKTPTAAAEFLLEQFSRQERYLERLKKDTALACNMQIQRNKSLLQQYVMQLNINLSKTLSRQHEKINHHLPHRLHSAMTNALNKEKLRLEQMRSVVNMLNPQNIMQRGYSITLYNGKPLRSALQAQHGDVLQTMLPDGVVKSVVA
jgi:exodeoxyribonuclease VII large subunit